MIELDKKELDDLIEDSNLTLDRLVPWKKNPDFLVRYADDGKIAEAYQAVGRYGNHVYYKEVKV